MVLLSTDPQAAKTTSPGGSGQSVAAGSSAAGNVMGGATNKRNIEKVNHTPMKRTKATPGKQPIQLKHLTPSD